MMRRQSETITITFGDRAENHRGNQIIGVEVQNGLTIEELEAAKIAFESQNFQCELINLNSLLNGSIFEGQAEEARLLIVRQGVTALLDGSNQTADDVFQQLLQLVWDKKYLDGEMVKNKLARHNVCMSDIAQAANYSEGKGTIIAFDQLPGLLSVRNNLPRFLGAKATGLQGEGNRYYNPKTCYIGWHGDKERKITVGLRFGEPMTLHYHWFEDWAPIGQLLTLVLNHGDIYVMSEKATGNDWGFPSFPTLRHSAGPNKFTIDLLNGMRQKRERRLTNQKERKRIKEEAKEQEKKESDKKIKII
jgi:hypothetical protein